MNSGKFVVRSYIQTRCKISWDIVWLTPGDNIELTSVVPISTSVGLRFDGFGFLFGGDTKLCFYGLEEQDLRPLSPLELLAEAAE